MIKYKVKDVASDLGVQNKEITEILEKYCGVNKKTMASLDESELDVIFDVMTKKNNVENFDSYFAARNEKLDGEVSKPAKSEKPEKPEKSKNTTDEKSGKKDNNSKKVKDNKENAKPEPAQKTEAPKKEEKQVEIKSEESVQRKRRVIDTRTSNINVDKYNSKYDDMASDSSKMRNTDNTIKKQKFSNRSQRQKGRRQGRRETEAERLKRIALERKQKPITVQIPDEILVSELALRLKATVAEVVKKAFLINRERNLLECVY